MRLHENNEDFRDLCSITADEVGIPEDAVRRDYYIVSMLQKLQQSDFAEQCVFKGGTSLSKCYPGSIERFSEDIDLTYLPSEGQSRKHIEKALKAIEKMMAEGYGMEKIEGERNDRNKSAFVFFDDGLKVKLEIGSSVRPDPYAKKEMKTYIQEYLENHGMNNVAAEYELEEVTVNTLAIERTFLDKVLSVKRHAICGTLDGKVRHIYDVTALFDRADIQTFLQDADTLKALLRKTKETDRVFLEKRSCSADYNPEAPYCFDAWKDTFDASIRKRYETLHEDLLYTNEKQNFDDALKVFEEIDRIFTAINE